jgi:hypothetical protein
VKTTHLLVTLMATTLPLTATPAEDTVQSETTDQKQEQNSNSVGNKGNMMSNWKDQDAEIDKLMAEMNSAPADTKLDAVIAVLTKLVEQRKAMQMQKMMSANEKEAMGMCRMMMGMDKGDDHDGEHSQHH